MACHHEIIIDNFRPGETVSYSIILIKGHINNVCQNGRIQSENSSFAVVDGKFKALSELKLGLNTIVLTYCSTTISISITYAHRRSNRKVLPLYIICEGHDGRFQAPETVPNGTENALRRITLCSKLLQCVFAEKLYEQNYNRKTVEMEDCKFFRSSLHFLEAWGMKQEELWGRLGREIANSGLGDEETKFLGFLSCTQYDGEEYRDGFLHEDIIKSTKAYVALGGGGLALFGTACLHTWPEDLSQVLDKFGDCTPIDKGRFMDDSCYRGTFGGCFSTTLGSVLHELCHTFDLGHTEKGIMGRGFDDIHKVFFCEGGGKKSLQRSFQNSIEFEEKSDEVGKKKFSIRDMSRIEEDGTFWTKSCLTFLAYHRWFNDLDTNNCKSEIKFDPVTKFLTSIAGLRVIELRKEDDGFVIKDWTFSGKVLKYSFQLPEEDLIELTEKSVILVVEDNVGNILRHTVNI